MGLVYALVKGIACNGLNKRYDFIFDNPLSDEALISQSLKSLNQP